MKKLQEYTLGHILRGTDDAFEQARAILLFRLCIMFTIIFFIPLITDILLAYTKVIVVQLFAFLMLLLMPVIIRKQNNIERSINLLFIICTFISLALFMMLNPTTLDTIGISWTIFFLILSALMQRGKMRLVFCCFLIWLPMFYILLNQQLQGALTWELILQKGAQNPPVFLLFIPIILSIAVVWTNTLTIEDAKQTIIRQKALIDEKNKDILDSIRYAKRIQNSLLPTDKYLEKNFKRLKKEA